MTFKYRKAYDYISVSVSIVDEYVKFLKSRPGGSFVDAQAQESAMKTNRFLALCGYTEGSDMNAVLEWEQLEVHDTYLGRAHRPGTIRSAIFACMAFLKWCKCEGRADGSKVDNVSANH